jgi:acyl-CoA synthetase (AMP-forming)/AMP-acid ligase II
MYMYLRNVLAASASSNNRPTIVPDRPEKHIRPTRNGVDELYVDELYIDLLIARLTEAGDTPVLRHKGQNTSAADLLKSIYRYARTLARIGIQRGSLVALFAPNCPDALAVRYAANLVGAASYYLSDPSDPQRRADSLSVGL